MKLVATLITLLTCFATAAEFEPSPPNPTDIRVVPIKPTPDPDNVETLIIFPKNNQIIYSNPVKLQLLLTGFPVGLDSDFDRRRLIYNNPRGQALRIFVDDYPFISLYKSFTDAFTEDDLYFDKYFNTSIPYNLEEGAHLLRAFPVRSYGECVRSPEAFEARIFYLGDRANGLKINLKKPFLTYNEPTAEHSYREGKPILLDFYLSNVMLSRDGYKVRLTIDGKIRRLLIKWLPFYIYGLKKGTHTIRLQLLNEQNKQVPGSFNDVHKTITIY